MSTNEFETIDYQSEARERYTQKFKDDAVYDAYVSLITKTLNDLQAVFKDLMQLRSLDTAEGIQLDVIGSLVGQSRELVDFNLNPFFGFRSALNAKTFGTLSNPSRGGLWRSLSDAEGTPIYLEDDDYRFLIKARIFANTTKSTSESILKGLNFLLGGSGTTITEYPNAHIKIKFGRELTELENYYLRGLSDQGSIIPIPIGVTLEFEFIAGYGKRYGVSYGH